MRTFRVLVAGDTALVIEFGSTIEREISDSVLALANKLNLDRLEGIVETVPTFRSLMVHYDPLVLSTDRLTAHITTLIEDLPAEGRAGHLWRLPVCYHPELAPDLADVASRTGLSPAQLVERHSAVTYHVYMLGFLPGFAYLGDVVPELVLPRREIPRPKLPAGSVAIAMTMTCIYPLESPGGWHLIGRSPVPLWRSQPTPGTLLSPGDRVAFAPVSLREYETLSAQAARGTLRIEPQDGLGAAA